MKRTAPRLPAAVPRKIVKRHLIRITWLVRSTGTAMRGLARWEGPRNPMPWLEADDEGRALAVGLGGLLERDDEGILWARGWSGPDVDALLAAAALSC